ncbi:MAG: glycoside hydrolase family 2, partial [Oscillospiraceae bacterium]|nr:glycoside hydrolase family 2 [Oscillospiraceae bacterium]
YLRYTDGGGELKPLERGILSVQVSGGELLGLGSACPYNELGYCGTRTDTYFGEALAVVRAGEGSAVELTVTDGRLCGRAEVPVG